MEKGLNDNAQDDAESHRILTELNLILHRDFDKVRFHQDRAYALNPNDPLIVSQRGEMGIWLGDAAEAETARVLESDPEFSVEAVLERTPYRLDSDREHQRNTMLKAGLPA